MSEPGLQAPPRVERRAISRVWPTPLPRPIHGSGATASRLIKRRTALARASKRQRGPTRRFLTNASGSCTKRLDPRGTRRSMTRSGKGERGLISRCTRSLGLWCEKIGRQNRLQCCTRSPSKTKRRPTERGKQRLTNLMDLWARKRSFIDPISPRRQRSSPRSTGFSTSQLRRGCTTGCGKHGSAAMPPCMLREYGPHARAV